MEHRWSSDRYVGVRAHVRGALAMPMRWPMGWDDPVDSADAADVRLLCDVLLTVRAAALYWHHRIDNRENKRRKIYRRTDSQFGAEQTYSFTVRLV